MWTIYLTRSICSTQSSQFAGRRFKLTRFKDTRLSGVYRAVLLLLDSARAAEETRTERTASDRKGEKDGGEKTDTGEHEAGMPLGREHNGLIHRDLLGTEAHRRP